MRNKKSRYDLQSVLSTACKLSCKRTALKRCTNIEILWYRKLVSLALPEFREILLPRSLSRWRADALNMPKVSTATGSKMGLCLIIIIMIMMIIIVIIFYTLGSKDPEG